MNTAYSDQASSRHHTEHLRSTVYDLSIQIELLLNAFTENTGLPVEEISLDTLSGKDAEPRLYFVSVRTKL